MLRPLFPLIVLALPALGVPATTVLTLVENERPTYNRLTVTVDPGLGLASTRTTDLTGNVTADLDVDPATGKTTELTLRDGRANATDMTFSNSNFFGNYNVSTANLSAIIFTTAPPGLVDGPTGNFDATQHTFSIDQGSVTGSATVLGTTTPVNIVLSPSDPFDGTGTGTGNVTLTPAGTSGAYLLFDVVATMPISIADTFDAGGTPVALTATGTLKAVGSLQVPESEYLAWTIAEGIPGADGQADANGDGVPNALAWAMGLGATENATGTLPRPTDNSPVGFELPIPSVGTTTPIRIEVSDTLGGWALLPAGRCSLGVNPIPAGHTGGSVFVTPSGNPAEFLRLSVDE